MWTLLAVADPYAQEISELAKAAQTRADAAYTMMLIQTMALVFIALLMLLVLIDLSRIWYLLRAYIKNPAHDKQGHVSSPGLERTVKQLKRELRATPDAMVIHEEESMQPRQSATHHPAVRGVMPDNQSPLPKAKT